MMRNTLVRLRQYRPYYNLPSKSEHGRKMTGFLTPYRHWMWKQNELWRNVHEAQFEHLRKVYKRQWLESFRVNADEYIYKYSITKAAQLAQWEHEMHAQEKARVEKQQLAQGRQALKKKHLDLLREFHERQFFYWYERASERLQYMSHINYIPQADFGQHLEKELNKYVAGSRSPYPLNFAGQLPLLEDSDGNIVQVPATLMTNHATENPDSSAGVYQPPEATAMAEDRLLELMASAQEEELLRLQSDESTAFSSALSDIEREEDERDSERKVARSMEETEAEREVSRRAYIDRGKTGSRTIFRRPRFEDEAGGDKDAAAPPESGSTPMKRKSRLDKMHALQEQEDAALAKVSRESMRTQTSENVKVGEAATRRGRLRDQAVMPTLEQLQQHPALSRGAQVGGSLRTGDVIDERYHRGKFKKGGDDEDM